MCLLAHAYTHTQTHTHMHARKNTQTHTRKPSKTVSVLDKIHIQISKHKKKREKLKREAKQMQIPALYWDPLAAAVCSGFAGRRAWPFSSTSGPQPWWVMSASVRKCTPWAGWLAPASAAAASWDCCASCGGRREARGRRWGPAWGQGQGARQGGTWWGSSPAQPAPGGHRRWGTPSPRVRTAGPVLKWQSLWC